MVEAPIGLAPNPAVFNDKILRAIREVLLPKRVWTVLDPFAGTGRIHELRPHYLTLGIELEPEWANHNGYADKGWTIVGDSLAVMEEWIEEGGWFHALITSPTYGNRMADHHEARDDSQRNTYRHKLGRQLSDNNSGAMQWGDEYREFHRRAWELATALTERFFILNIKDHIRKGERQHVTDWHHDTLTSLGWNEVERVEVPTRGNRFGENADVRVDSESVIVFGRSR